MYSALGNNGEERRLAYRDLFKGMMAESTLSKIRDSTNKGWLLGGTQFKKQIEAAANRRLESTGLGGDRKSKFFREIT